MKKDTTSILCRDILGNAHIVPVAELVRRSSAYGIIKHDGQVLLVSDRTSNGRWDLPGGGIESGEDRIAALSREITEETGLKVAGEPQSICEFREYFYDVDSQKGWESTRSFYEVRCEGEPHLGHNGDDIVEGKYFKAPFNDKAISATTREVLRIANA